MKVRVDDDACRGHGVCLATCPEVFDLSDGGYAVVTVDEVPTEHADAVRDAASNCPERAIIFA
ncbi:MAG: ferredoxin [Rhodococcus sp.]|uniref:ferredoxin n=1 Tax=Rhodococcus TaxID=1827 RepID=UPI0016910582|nr:MULTISPECIES: ferredoxin [Rhodococcus]NLV80093.1 ferredoxin [Rhodococcus sp. (in: high G+C Gram-positive bacteria)]